MKKLILGLLIALASGMSAHATVLEERVSGGKFVDCEFVEIGQKGEIRGNLTLTEIELDQRWAPVIGLVLIDDSKFQVTFRLALASVTNSNKLEARYEFFSAGKRQVAEALAQIPIGEPANYHLAWDSGGLVQLSVAGSAPRHLVLNMSPTRAFVLMSGGRGKISTEGAEKLDCSRDLFTAAKQ